MTPIPAIGCRKQQNSPKKTVNPKAKEPETDVRFRGNDSPVNNMEKTPITIQWVDGMGGKLAIRAVRAEEKNIIRRKYYSPLTALFIP